MTTIATDGRTMAADSQTTAGDEYVVSIAAKKIEKTPSGKIVGCCGPCGDEQLFIDWLENAGRKPKLNAYFSAIVLHPTEGAFVYYSDCTRRELREPHAIGSGAVWAIAAMDFGKTPEQAVEYACGRDIHTGGTVVSMSVEPNTEVRRAA